LGDVLGVRPYRRGDPLRRIHWGQSARHDRLIICEQQATACPRVQVVVDLHPDYHAGAGPQSSREWAVRIAASFAEAALSHASLVEMVLPDVVIAYDLGTTQRRRILDALARSVGRRDRPLDWLLSQPNCQAFGGLQLVVTTLGGLKRMERGLVSRRGRFVIALDERRFTEASTASDNGCFHHASRLEALGHVFRIDSPRHLVEQTRAIWKELLCVE
ncbi:MAG: DUF58 domain-containing protein, partial [Gemmatales bacterium]|nr:DUF58 domain-containing protein [Gemmatales bacterium]MDW8386113.1 DUF58 domain-containing protein [Gemmatales bacterium]